MHIIINSFTNVFTYLIILKTLPFNLLIENNHIYYSMYILFNYYLIPVLEKIANHMESFIYSVCSIADSAD